MPNSEAVRPDSNSPNWFDVPTNIEFTADTRPRMASGVCSCTSDERTTMESTSEAPSTASARSDSGKEVDRPKATVARPKSATARNIFTPARLASGCRASTKEVSSAPTAGAARSTPSPIGVVCRMSRA